MKTKLLLLTFLFMSITASAKVTFIETQGWLESAFTEWNLIDGADTYHVYCKEAGGDYFQ